MTISTVTVAFQEAEAARRTIGEFLASGGELMIPIGICSVLVLGLALERTIALRRRRTVTRAVDEALEALVQGHPDAARARLEGDASLGARVLQAGLRRHGYALGDVEGAMEDQALKEIEKMRRNVRPLVLIGGIAPLLGLLGTVLGIAEAFRRVSETGMGKPEALAAGIDLALTTTIAGLSVAIPAMILAAWLQGRVRHLALWADECLAPAVEALAVRPGGPAEETHAA